MSFKMRSKETGTVGKSWFKVVEQYANGECLMFSKCPSLHYRDRFCFFFSVAYVFLSGLDLRLCC